MFRLLFLAACALPLAAIEGRVVYAEGEVSVIRGGATVKAAVGSALGEGDLLRTGADGLAILAIGAGVEVKLKERTTLAMDSLGDRISVTLRSGAAFSKVVRKLVGGYELRAAGTVAGVRGTEFFVAYGRTIDAEPDVWLCVNEGSVDVALPAVGASVVVEEGEGINILGSGRLTAPRRYPWTRKLNWNTDPSAGDVVDRTSIDAAYGDLLDQDYD
jgi:ferric-dicitrate binding protein FerR (iron transport regulator)